MNDISDTEPAGAATHSTGKRRLHGWMVAASLTVMVTSAAVLIPLCGLGVMFTASCSPLDDRLLCSPVGVRLLMGAPIAGLILGVVLTLIGTHLSRRRGQPLGAWLLAGWLVYASGLGYAVMLTDQEQSFESKAAEESAQQAAEDRGRAEELAERAARPNLEDAAGSLQQLREHLDTELSPMLGFGLAWTPARGNSTCRQMGVAGAGVLTTAALDETERDHWPTTVDAVTRVARQERMAPADAEDTSAGEHRYLGTDGTVFSANARRGTLEVRIYSGCRLTGADRDALGR